MEWNVSVIITRFILWLWFYKSLLLCIHNLNALSDPANKVMTNLNALSDPANKFITLRLFFLRIVWYQASWRSVVKFLWVHRVVKELIFGLWVLKEGRDSRCGSIEENIADKFIQGFFSTSTQNLRNSSGNWRRPPRIWGITRVIEEGSSENWGR